NERNTLVIGDTDGGRLVEVTQIAGLIARRIVCHKAQGDDVQKGERIGLIKFGSRVDVVLGPEWDLAVEKGDKVAGGSSVLATSD
ncbi:MAG: phosphatidylserine decarboxylase, partial [Bryobacterales bacterium]|nr:phosphatidylserine decarboxylase [Bryobacterales bacterium]